MSGVPDLPAWAAWTVSVLCLGGAAITLIGVIGLVRLRTFYERVHAPSLGATLGGGLILVASIVCFSTLRSRPVMGELMIGAFFTVTTPVGMMLLARAALYRDRTEGDPAAPSDD